MDPGQYHLRHLTDHLPQVGHSYRFFGIIFELESKSATTVFVVVVAILATLQSIINLVEKYAQKTGNKDLLERLKSELTLLGTMSFGLFVIAQATSDSLLRWKEAYAFVHIMLMFIAAVTVVQTIFLARLATSEHKNLSAWKDLNLKQLCEDYDYIMENKFASFVFHWLPFWLHVPSLRQEMEYKVMERYFTHMHQLPEGFPFANYMGKVFRQHVLTMGQYSTAVWGGLAILIVINLARIHTVNSYYETPICYNDPSAKYKGSRLTCYEFVLEYAFVLLNFLSMYILLLLKASCTYLIRVLKRSMTEEGVPADRHGYRIVLGLWAQEEKMKQLRAANKDKDNNNSNHSGGGVATTVGGKKIRDGKVNEESGGGADAEGDTSEPEDKLLSDMASVLAEGGGRKRATLTLRELNRITEEEEQEIEEEIRFAPPIRRPFLMLHNYLFRQRGTTLVELFLGHSPAIYFGAVELAVLLQNFYIAMWASNLAFFAKNSRYKISWEASMIVWTIFNQIILRRVLLISSYIKALYKLDESFADQAVEESQAEEVAFDRLATETYSQLRKKGIPMRRWRKHLSDLFNDIDRRSTGTLTRTQFRSFLVESGVYFATENVDYLFSLLETPQKKGRVLYKDLFTTLFPELRDTAASSAATGAAAAGATISVAAKKGDDSTHASENYGWPVDEISMVTL